MANCRHGWLALHTKRFLPWMKSTVRCSKPALFYFLNLQGCWSWVLPQECSNMHRVGNQRCYGPRLFMWWFIPKQKYTVWGKPSVYWNLTVMVCDWTDLSVLTPVDWVYPNGSQHTNDQYHIAFFFVVINCISTVKVSGYECMSITLGRDTLLPWNFAWENLLEFCYVTA